MQNSTQRDLKFLASQLSPNGSYFLIKYENIGKVVNLETFFANLANWGTMEDLNGLSEQVTPYIEKFWGNDQKFLIMAIQLNGLTRHKGSLLCNHCCVTLMNDVVVGGYQIRTGMNYRETVYGKHIKEEFDFCEEKIIPEPLLKFYKSLVSILFEQGFVLKEGKLEK